jgi:hypothetical protein
MGVGAVCVHSVLKIPKIQILQNLAQFQHTWFTYF